MNTKLKTKRYNKGKDLAYLAIPYSHPNNRVELKRFHLANVAATKLIKNNHIVFSPISSSHVLKTDSGLDGDWKFWSWYDLGILKLCKKLFVLKIDGWRESVGVTAEIAAARKLKIPIQYLNAKFID